MTPVTATKLPDEPTKPFPHVNAAFINAIAEEGTKADAIKYLQDEWNENVALYAHARELRQVASTALEEVKGLREEVGRLKEEKMRWANTASSLQGQLNQMTKECQRAQQSIREMEGEIKEWKDKYMSAIGADGNR